MIRHERLNQMHRNREFRDIQCSPIMNIGETPTQSTLARLAGGTIFVQVFHWEDVHGGI